MKYDVEMDPQKSILKSAIASINEFLGPYHSIFHS